MRHAPPAARPPLPAPPGRSREADVRMLCKCDAHAVYLLSTLCACRAYAGARAKHIVRMLCTRLVDSSRVEVYGALALAQLVPREPGHRGSCRGRDDAPASEGATAITVPSGPHELPHQVHCTSLPPPRAERVSQLGKSSLGQRDATGDRIPIGRDWLLWRRRHGHCLRPGVAGRWRCLYGIGALVPAPHVELLLQVWPPVVRMPSRLPHLRHPWPTHATKCARAGLHQGYRYV